MSKFSPMERILYDALEENAGQVMDIDALGDRVYRKVRPKNWRNSLKAIMRGLIMKTESRLIKVRRVSGIGRGKAAEYVLDKSGKGAFLFNPDERES